MSNTETEKDSRASMADISSDQKSGETAKEGESSNKELNLSGTYKWGEGV